MADASASERAYQRLKSDILNGVLTGPLDIRTLGDRMRMSVTPVREALARLNAERLVKLAPHQGYVLAAPSARRLGHIYELAGALVDLGLDGHPAPDEKPVPSTSLRRGAGYAIDMADLLCEIVNDQANLELSEHAVALNDRLLPARRCEPIVFAEATAELGQLRSLWNARNFLELRSTFRVHYRQRIDHAGVIAGLLADQAERALR